MSTKKTKNWTEIQCMSKSNGSFSSNSSIDCLLKKSFDMKYTCTSIKLNKKKYQCSKDYHK